MTSPLLSFPVYSERPNRPDRNFLHDYYSLAISHFLGHSKRFLKSMTSFYARLEAFLPETEHLVHSENVSSNVTSKIREYEKVDPLYVSTPGFQLKGSGIPLYPLKLSKNKFNLTWVLDLNDSQEDENFPLRSNYPMEILDENTTNASRTETTADVAKFRPLTGVRKRRVWPSQEELTISIGKTSILIYNTLFFVYY